MDQIAIAANVLAGGASGYITNKYAVKMLFHKYGRFGGVILDTRDAFIKNLSELVERDIINGPNLQGAFRESTMQAVYGAIAQNVLNQQLYQHTKDCPLMDLPGMEKTIDRFNQECQADLGSLVAQILDIYVKNTDVNMLFDQRQCAYLAERFVKLGLEILEDQDMIWNFIQGFVQEQRDTPLTDLIAPTLFRTVGDNVARQLDKLPALMNESYAGRTDEMLYEVYRESGIQDAVRQFEAAVKEKRIEDMIGRQNIAAFQKSVLQGIVKLLRSNMGQKQIQILVDRIFNDLKTVPQSLFSLLQPGIEEALVAFLRKNLPVIIEKLLYQIRQAKADIDRLINNALDDTLKKRTSWLDLRADLLYCLRHIFLPENISSRYEFVKLIQDGIRQGADVPKISQDLCDYILRYLKNKPIGEMVADMEQTKILRKNDVVDFINYHIEHYLPKLKLDMFAKFYQMKIKDFLFVNLSDLLEDAIQKKLIEDVKQKFLCAPQTIKKLQTSARDEIYRLSRMSLKDVFTQENTGEIILEIQSATVHYLKENSESIARQIASYLSNWLVNKKVNDFLPDALKKQAQNHWEWELSDRLATFSQDMKQTSLHRCFQLLQDARDLEPWITNFALRKSETQLNSFLEGRVKQAVADNLKTVSDAELELMVEDFMGKELKPINTIGAVAGAAAGMGFYAFSSRFFTDPTLWAYLSSCALYSAIGYGTNVLALKMIFRPYQPIRIFGKPILWTQGVIAKQKPRFAISMADFIGDKLLNQEYITKIFTERSADLGTYLKSQIDMQRMIQENMSVISPTVIRWTDTLFTAHHAALSANLKTVCDTIQIPVAQYDFIEKFFYQYAQKMLDQADGPMTKWLLDGLHSETPLKKYLPEIARRSIDDQIRRLLEQNFAGIQTAINDERQFQSLTTTYAKEFDNFLKQPLNKILTEQQKEAIYRELLTYLKSEVFQKEISWIYDALVTEMQPDKEFRDLFGGTPYRILQDYKDILLNGLQNRTLELMREHSSAVKASAYESYQEKNPRWGDLGNKVLGIKSAINDIVDEIIERRLPDFLTAQKHHMDRLFTDGLQTTIAPTTLHKLGIQLDQKNISDIMQRILQQSEQNKILAQLIRHIIEGVGAIPLRELMGIISIRNLADCMEPFEQEIKSFRFHLSSNIEANKQNILRIVEQFVHFLLAKCILNKEIRCFAEGMREEDIRRTAKQTLGKMRNSHMMDESLRQLIQAYVMQIQGRETETLLDTEHLANCLLDSMHSLLQNAETFAVIEGIVGDALHSIAERSLRHPDAKKAEDFFTDLIAKSIISAIELHFVELLRALKLKSVAEDQMNEMSPQKIEEMFDSFARPYFRKVEQYGLASGVLGIFVTALLSILKID